MTPIKTPARWGGCSSAGHRSRAGQGIRQTVGWAATMQGSRFVGTGRIIFCGDSGWIADVSGASDTGMFQNGDNDQFAANCLAWLAGL